MSGSYLIDHISLSSHVSESKHIIHLYIYDILIIYLSIEMMFCLFPFTDVKREEYTVKPVLRGHLWGKEKVAL